MGEIVASMELENTSDSGIVRRGLRDESTVRRATVEGVVDAGAIMLVLPEDVVGRLGLRTQRQVAVIYADKRRKLRPVAGPVTVHIGNRSMITDCVVGPPSSKPLIGHIVLARLDLVADCRNHTLGPRPESPDYPLLKMKGAVPAEALPMPDATVMRDDPVIEAVREVRHRISESVGHDPHRLVAYDRQRQERRRNQPVSSTGANGGQS